MGWSHCGTDDNGREIGYGVPAVCDFPGCGKPIHRGLAYVCGQMHGGGDHGCGGYFCYEHLFMTERGQLCPTCAERLRSTP